MEHFLKKPAHFVWGQRRLTLTGSTLLGSPEPILGDYTPKLAFLHSKIGKH
jgi:hypothetical protein